MKQRELLRQQNEKLNDLEAEAKEKAEYLLEKANAQRLEQEDEVKHLNEVSHCLPGYIKIKYIHFLSLYLKTFFVIRL